MLHSVVRTLASACILGAGVSVIVPVIAHVGHGDEFQQQGDIRQVKSNSEQDALLGISTEPAQNDPAGVTLPMSAVIQADGKTLVFVKSEGTYDPVIVTTGDARDGRVVVLTGVTPGENVVVQGALSLYAESKKTQQPQDQSKTGANEATEKPLNVLGVVGALAVVSAIGIGIVRGRPSSK